jgi:hypothetical protein
MSLMNLARRAAILLFLFILPLTLSGPAQAQSSDVLFFPETGHNVKGDFLRYYNNVREPELLFGYPITEQFISKDGKTVQYFQRVRFERRADLSDRVQLTPVGQAAYTAGSQQLNINNSQGCEVFPTGFRVCFAFLDFYKLNNGSAQFGNPISPFEYQENLIVQYFEKARFEWRADRPEGQRVVLTDLGRYYFDQLGEDAAHLRPIDPLDATINPILSINARAFVMKPVALTSGTQTVHIVVQSQTHQPVSNANGKATIRLTDGRTQEYFFSTNASGLGSITFDFADQKEGELVPIDIIVTYQGLPATTTTSFRIWF